MRAESHAKDVSPPEPGTHSLWDVREFTNIKFSWHTLWLYMGPGWLMSIAFLDPGNIEGSQYDVDPGAELAQAFAPFQVTSSRVLQRGTSSSKPQAL